MGVVFCDYLNCTVPLSRADDLVAELHPLLLEAGFTAHGDASAYNVLYRTAMDGTVKLRAHTQVLCIGASGYALAALRAANLWANYLACLGAQEHRVTQIDAALDLLMPSQPFLLDVRDKGRSGCVRLSRKAVRPITVREWFAPAHYDEATITGTVYLGLRTSEAYAKVYDKRDEMLAKGHGDPGPLTRIEVTARGGLGVSLRDAWQPTELFYHLASPDLIPRPAGIADWVPRGEGYVLPTRTKLDPAAALKRRIESSLELAALAELADRIGPQGRPYLANLLRRQVLGKGVALVAAAETVPGASGAAVDGQAAEGAGRG